MPNNKKSYNELQNELNEILEWFANEDDFSVDVAIEKYQRGNAIIAELELYLKNTKNKIEKIKLKQQ